MYEYVKNPNMPLSEKNLKKLLREFKMRCVKRMG